MDDLPHLAWPITVTGNTYTTVQQDTNDEVAANIAVLCCFPRGWRAEQPDFGITDPTFQQMPVDPSEIERQSAIYEPRAGLTITVRDDPDPGSQRVNIAVQIAEEVIS